MRALWLLLGLVLLARPHADAPGGAAATGGEDSYHAPHGTESAFLAESAASLLAVIERNDLPRHAGGRTARGALAALVPGELARSATPEALPGVFIPLCQRLPFHANAPPV